MIITVFVEIIGMFLIKSDRLVGYSSWEMSREREGFYEFVERCYWIFPTVDCAFGIAYFGCISNCFVVNVL